MKLFKYVFFVAFILIFTDNASSHCDHLDGPVVNDARIAIEQRDITPVLKWIDEEDEAELKNVFEKTVRVRAAGGEAQELADLYFFETLVRLHRASEGAPYTGLKPAGTPVAGYVMLSDNALKTGSTDEIVAHLTEALEQNIREKFQDTYSQKQYKSESVEAGREYVHSYVEFVHYVKHIVEVIKHGNEAHHAEH